ncbi:MAG: transmembrane 220 family protein [Longimicrobiales bacterium]
MRRTLWTAANALLFFAFLFSVAVQYNDPDPLRWMIVYGAAAVACILEMRRRTHPLFPITIALIAFAWTLSILPDVRGRVHSADLFASFEMKNAVVEQAREMGGLFIVTVWMLILATAAVLPWRRPTPQRSSHSLEHRLPAEYGRRLLLRGVTFWLLIQLTLAMLLARGSQDVEATLTGVTSPSPTAALSVTAVVAALAYIETGIRRERIFVANLGVAPITFVVVPAAVAAVLSCALMFARSRW